jgi:hypothetical protein
VSDDLYRGPWGHAPMTPRLTEDDHNKLLTRLELVRKGTKEIKVPVSTIRDLLHDNLALYYALRPLHTKIGGP